MTRDFHQSSKLRSMYMSRTSVPWTFNLEYYISHENRNERNRNEKNPRGCCETQDLILGTGVGIGKRMTIWQAFHKNERGKKSPSKEYHQSQNFCPPCSLVSHSESVRALRVLPNNGRTQVPTFVQQNGRRWWVMILSGWGNENIFLSGSRDVCSFPKSSWVTTCHNLHGT
jgi:hypothetical protein